MAGSFTVLVSPHSPVRFAVSPSAREPGRWQLTRFDGDEPTGHTAWDSPDEATASACGQWVNRQPPVGDCTFRVLPEGIAECRDEDELAFYLRHVYGVDRLPTVAEMLAGGEVITGVARGR